MWVCLEGVVRCVVMWVCLEGGVHNVLLAGAAVEAGMIWNRIAHLRRRQGDPAPVVREERVKRIEC